MRTNRLLPFAILAFGLVVPNADADVPEILWRVPVNAATPGWRPAVASDGMIYWDSGLLHKVSPAGAVQWTRPVGDGKPVDIGPDGEIYAVSQNDLHAFSPTGDLLWTLDLPVSQGFIGGPTVGPDGFVYAALEGVAMNTGVLKVSMQGEVEWSYPGFVNRGGAPGSEMVFGADGRVYKSEEVAPTGGDLQEGLLSIDATGDLEWAAQISAVGRQPIVSPTTGFVHITVSRGAIRTYRPDGGIAWEFMPDDYSLIATAPAVGPDGSVYLITDSRRLIAVDDQGQTRWSIEGAVPPGFPRPLEVSPDGSMLVFGTSGCFGGSCPGHVIAYSAASGTLLWDLPLPTEEGGRVPTAETRPRFSRDGRIVYIGAAAYPGFDRSFLYAIRIAAGAPCEVDLDGSGAADVPDIFEFLARWFASDTAADFDGDGTLAVPDIFVFLSAWFAGC